MHLASKRSIDRIASISGFRELAFDADRTGLLAGISPSPTSAAEAFECLVRVGERLRGAGDPRAAFTDVYAIITRRVRDALEDRAAPVFQEPAFISRLAGRFCALYLAALRRSVAGEPEPIAAWAVADRRKGSPRTLPVQHALLGLNAHINYDLAIGLHANVLALGAAGDAARMARFRHDHDAVNRILEAAVPEVLELLRARYGCPVARLALSVREQIRGAACRLVMVTLASWRSRVWDDLVAMLGASGPAGAARVEARMGSRAGLFARLLGLPLPAL
jgi:Family of unknown function (DUF5995)